MGDGGSAAASAGEKVKRTMVQSLLSMMVFMMMVFVMMVSLIEVLLMMVLVGNSVGNAARENNVDGTKAAAT